MENTDRLSLPLANISGVAAFTSQLSSAQLAGSGVSENIGAILVKINGIN